MTSFPEPRRTAGVLVVTWVVLVGVVLGVGWLLTHPLAASVGAWDDDVERWLAEQRTSGLDRAASVGTFLGNTVVGLVLALVVAVSVSVWRRSARPAAYVGVLVVGAFALYVAATQVVSRDRPPVRILDPGLVPDHSFPSGHTVTAVVVYGGTALLLSRVAPRTIPWVWTLLAVPPVVMAARLYQGAHHPSDVLTAVVAASVWVAAVGRLVPVTEPGGVRG